MDDKQINNAVKSALNESASNLNSETLHRLRQARETALLKSNKSGGVSFLSWKWITGTGAGLSITGLCAFMLVTHLNSSSGAISPLDDLDLLTAEVELDLVDHLDFYQWLDESLDES